MVKYNKYMHSWELTDLGPVQKRIRYTFVLCLSDNKYWIAVSNWDKDQNEMQNI